MEEQIIQTAINQMSDSVTQAQESLEEAIQEHLDNSESILNPEEEALLNQVLENEHNEIPLNSPTLLVDETTSRFTDAIWYNKIKEQLITIAGVGGIGSHVAFLVSRLKPARITLYDPDNVETVNMSGQLYGTMDIGYSKVSRISYFMRQYSEYYGTIAHQSRFVATSVPDNILICGFDNMSARRAAFEAWKNKLKSSRGIEDKFLFIDGRLAAEELQVLSIQGNDERAIKEYEEKWLFDDSEAEETVCSYKQTSFMADMIASIMVNVLVNFVANMCNPIIDRDVPFFISYDASTMFTKMRM